MFELFFIVAILLLGGVQYYMYHTFRKYIVHYQSSLKARYILNLVFIAFNIPLLVIALLQPNISSAPTWTILSFFYPLYLWHFSCLILFLLLMIRNIIWLIYRLFRILARSVMSLVRPKESNLQNTEQFQTARRKFLRQSTYAAASIVVGGSIYGAIRKDDFETSIVSVPITGLPDQFDGFSIGFLSDIHSSIFMTRQEMELYAKAVNDLHADLIVVAGDFVNSHVDEVYPFAEAFSQLRAPSGVYGVLGNHDYYTRKVETVAKNVNDCGIKLLVNEHVALEKEGKKICLLGSDDVGSVRMATEAFRQSKRGIDAAIPKILMCHRPYYFQQAVDEGMNLVLSGHTHGGQIVFAKIGNDIIAPARFASPYVAGMYTIGTSKMYVSRGIGTVGVPVRLNCPPEITKIVLRMA